MSGYSAPLQSLSTSTFKIGSGPASIIGLEDPNLPSFTLQHTIALPYLLDGTMSDDDLQ